MDSNTKTDLRHIPKSPIKINFKLMISLCRESGILKGVNLKNLITRQVL